MYASNTVTCSNSSNSEHKQNIPVETYENRAVLNELSRRSDTAAGANCTNSTCSCRTKDNDKISNSCTDALSNNEQCCNCNNDTKNKCASVFHEKFGIDDAIILLLIILLLTDGNSSNDIMLPILLGVLLLT